MSEIKFLKNYFNSLTNLFNNDKYLNDSIELKKILLKY